MKLIDKAFIGTIILAITHPGSAVPAGLSLLLFVLIWEFVDAVARQTALNEYVEKSMDRKALKFLDWLAIRTKGERLSE